MHSSNSKKSISNTTIEKLQQITDEFLKSQNISKPRSIWMPFLKNVFDGIIKIDYKQQVVVNLVYMKKIVHLLSKTDDRILGKFLLNLLLTI